MELELDDGLHEIRKPELLHAEELLQLLEELEYELGDELKLDLELELEDGLQELGKPELLHAQELLQLLEELE